MRPTTSASNLFRRALCPGSARMEEGLPDEDSVESREGDLLHHYQAHPEYVRSVLKPPQRDLLKLAKELEDKFFETVESNFGVKASVQRREFETWFENVSGHPDVARRYLEKSLTAILDYKFGYKIVERAELNLQLRCYASMVEPSDLATLQKPETVVVAIVQPRLSYSERITMAKYTRSDIEQAQQQIRSILEASEHPDAPLVAGEEQCRYCKAKLICSAYRQMLSQIPWLATTDPKLSVGAREGRIIDRLSECTDQQLAAILEACAMAEFVNQPAHDEARRRIKADRKSVV